MNKDGLIRDQAGLECHLSLPPKCWEVCASHIPSTGILFFKGHFNGIALHGPMKEYAKQVVHLSPCGGILLAQFCANGSKGFKALTPSGENALVCKDSALCQLHFPWLLGGQCPWRTCGCHLRSPKPFTTEQVHSRPPRKLQQFAGEKQNGQVCSCKKLGCLSQNSGATQTQYLHH